MVSASKLQIKLLLKYLKVEPIIHVFNYFNSTLSTYTKQYTSHCENIYILNVSKLQM